MNMKKVLILSLWVVATLLTTTSCEDQLNKEPYDAISEDKLFSTPKGFTNAILATYRQFTYDENARKAVYYGGPMFSIPDVLTDNVILNTSGRQSLRIVYDWLYAPNNNRNDVYINAYKVVHNANLILGNSSKLTDADFKKNIEGEALTARALAHFDLVRFYGKIPTQSADANAALGIAYVTKVDNLQKPSRITVKEVYDRIIDDLLEAKDKINLENPPGRFNLNSVNALLSRVYLYMGKWQESADAANAVVGAVASKADFPLLWTDQSNKGIISEFLVRQVDRIAIGEQFSQTGPDGVRSEYNISFELYELYKNNDIRKSAYVSTSVFDKNEYNHIKKYFGKTGQVNGIVNAKVIRMAEVMLNKAEALSELPGQDGAALTALDAVRSQRYDGFTSGNETGPALKEAIALERRLEFAFESHRFFDLKRKGLAIERADYGDLSDGGGAPPTYKKLPAGDFKFQYAIPQQATQANPNLKQNPGY